jgi:alkylation response protein AidB-like acyl-CoA dehydrogenase
LLNDPAASPTHVSFGVRPYDGRPGADVMVVLLRAFAPLSIDALRPALHDAVGRLVRPATAPALEPSAALDAGAQDATQLCAMAKRVATDAGFKAANDALQLLGGYGYLAEYGIEKIVRDLRVHQILEGTNEIMRLIVARELVGR